MKNGRRAVSIGRWVGLVYLLGAIVLVAGAATASGGPPDDIERAAVATTPHFAFYDDFETNLHDALLEAGRRRAKAVAEVFEGGDEAACFEALPPSARAGWNEAVDYYAEILSPGSFGERPQYLVRVDLVGFEEEIEDERAESFVAIAGAMRAAAAPAYEACRWEARSAANRRWIESLLPQLAAHEEAIGERLGALYHRDWTGLPIPVDVVETVSWSGANSMFWDAREGYPAKGNIWVATSYQGPSALEIVFHEASHQMMRRGEPVGSALWEASQALDRELPRDLWHVVLFYTTGETVRRALAAAGEPAYEPMIYEIWARGGSWSVFQEAVETIWSRYLDGETTLDEAATGLVRAVGEPIS